MELRTVIELADSAHKISLKDNIMAIGSCFSDVIGNKLKENKFFTSINPYGTIFNPHAIFKALNYTIKQEQPHPDTYAHFQGMFFNHDFHSVFCDLEQKLLEEKIKECIAEAASFIKKTSWLIITFGTAWVYTKKSNKKIVANSHQLPAGSFSKKLLSVKEIATGFDQMFAELSKVNPSIHIILTVSPVRHTKETLPPNMLSKSVLRLACEEICSKYTCVDYFPAYEVMLDDLRDYRFYKPDMLHPNEIAENYIWNLFLKKYLDKTTIGFIKEWQKMIQALRHKPFYPASDAHQSFIKNTIKKLKSFHDQVDISKEMQILESQLSQDHSL